MDRQVRVERRVVLSIRGEITSPLRLLGAVRQEGVENDAEVKLGAYICATSSTTKCMRARIRSIEAGPESFSAIFAGQSLRAPLAHCPLDPEVSGIERQRVFPNEDLGVRT